MSTSTSNEPLSYCGICDKGPGQCEHAGPRYLQPIAYEKVSGGWRVPDPERKRWDYEGWGKSSGSPHWRETSAPKGPVPMTLQQIIESFDGIIFLDQTLSTNLHDAYELYPIQVSQLATHAATSASLTNPAGFLATKLREMLA